MPAARFGTGLNKIKKGLFSTGLAKIKAGYMYESGGWNKVWSFGSRVSYYDGDTLMGVEEIDDGQDVLHPSFSTSKQGYTLYGWATEADSDTREETMLATGEPITLYAIYVPNSVVVASGNASGTSVWNTKYVGGGSSVCVESYGDSKSAYTTVTVDRKQYQNVSITIGANKDWGQGYSQPDNFYDSVTQTYLPSGTTFSDRLSGMTYGVHSFPIDHYERHTAWVSNITLSNPIAWT